MTLFSPTAILGSGCVLPGALTAEAYWDLVVHEKIAISDPAGTAWGLAPETWDVLAREERPATTAGGYVTGFADAWEKWDLARYGTEPTPDDTLSRWLVWAGRAALHEGGYAAGDAVLGRCGIVLGNLCYPTSEILGEVERRWRRAKSEGSSPTIGDSASEPLRTMARVLGCGGPVLALDAACASALYAFFHACRLLEQRACDLVLVGGANAADDLFLHSGFTALQALSKTGRSRPFASTADGLLPAHGAVVFLLRRARDVSEDRDKTQGIVHAVGLANDGASPGFLAPQASGQIAAMRAAYQGLAAGLAPEQVSYIECHATGTRLGDGQEVASVAQAFGDGPRLGSVKGNIGHPLAAAGGASLLKVLLSFRHGILPGNPHKSDLDPDVAKLGPRILTDGETWTRAEQLAAVNAFGFGGNNAHLLVEAPGRRSGLLGAKAFAVSGGARGGKHPTHRGTPSADGLVLLAASVALGRSSGCQLAADVLAGRAPGGVLSSSLPPGGVAAAVSLPLARMRTPPSDLQDCRPQQLLVIERALEALDVTVSDQIILDERTAIIATMTCDPEITRHGLRWRYAAPLTREFGSETATRLLAAIAKPLSPARVVGTMPNILANRLNRLLDARGPSFALAAGSESGQYALWLAEDLLASRLVDTVLVVTAEDLERSRAGGDKKVTAQTPGGEDGWSLAGASFAANSRRAPETGGNPFGVSGGGVSSGVFLSAALVVCRPNDGRALRSSGLRVTARVIHGRPVAIDRLTSRARQWRELWMPRVGTAAAHLCDVALSALVARLEAETALGSDVAGEKISAPRPPPRLAAAPAAAASLPAAYVFTAASGDELANALVATDASRRWQGGGAGYDPYRAVILTSSPWEAERERLLPWIASLRGLPPGDRPFSAIPGVFVGHVNPAFTRPEALAFVFTGASSYYAGAGRELVHAFPELARRVADRLGGSAEAFFCESGGAKDRDSAPSPFEHLLGSSLVAQIHHELAVHVFALRPGFHLGVSSGLTNALLAAEVWECGADLLGDVLGSELYSRHLSGTCEVANAFWSGTKNFSHPPTTWENWRVLAGAAEVGPWLTPFSRARIVATMAEGDYVVGGPKSDLRALMAQIGSHRTAVDPYSVSVHCPEAASFAPTWVQLHTRATQPRPDIRIFSAGTAGELAQSESGLARVYEGELTRALDFPRMIDDAYRAGCRTFIELGPKGGCTRWIRSILDGRPHVALALDQPKVGRALHLAGNVAELWVSGLVSDRVFREFVPIAIRPRQAGGTDVRMPVGLQKPLPSLEAILDVAHEKIRH